jgi:hypothetical protein
MIGLKVGLAMRDTTTSAFVNMEGHHRRQIILGQTIRPIRVELLFVQVAAEAGHGLPGIQVGAFSRTILETASEALSAHEIAEVLARRSHRPAGAAQMASLLVRVRNALARLSEKPDEKLIDRTPDWRVKA